MTNTGNPDRVRADQERRRSGAAGKQDGAKRKLANNRSAAKRSWKRSI